MKSNQIDTFIENCQYLGLKKLPVQYESIIDKANKSNVGFLDFIAGVIQDETNARRERSTKYRLKMSKLPQPYKMLQDYDFPFQPKLKKKLIELEERNKNLEKMLVQFRPIQKV